jgi:hypothetical protein
MSWYYCNLQAQSEAAQLVLRRDALTPRVNSGFPFPRALQDWLDFHVALSKNT